MSNNNEPRKALGMIETLGLVPAIEAADAACKAAKVKLVGKEKVKGGIITVKIIGDVAAVRSAVDAGASAAQKIGQVLSTHVIPNPIEDLNPYIYDFEIQIDNKIVRQKYTKQNTNNIPNENPNDENIKQLSINDSFLQISKEELFKKLDSMTVHELRRMARGLKGLSIYGREISKANKETLIKEIMNSYLKKD